MLMLLFKFIFGEREKDTNGFLILLKNEKKKFNEEFESFLKKQVSTKEEQENIFKEYLKFIEQDEKAIRSELKKEEAQYIIDIFVEENEKKHNDYTPHLQR